MRYEHTEGKKAHAWDLGQLVQSASFCLLTFVAPQVFANPTGGNVAAGQASIRYGQTTVVTQTSTRAVVNWKDFSINQDEITQFNLPSRNAVTLNRVVGANPSQILGHLQSNGQVFLVNPNGIIFGKTARVDVAGLVASTADITNKDFMEGNYHFTNAPEGSQIINEGNITVSGAGLAALVAPNVANRGIIQAQLGRVALASGSAFTVDLYGDNLITFDASSTVKGAIDNTGRIAADGGTVLLTVAAAEGIVENVVNTSGYISAQSVGVHNGKIQLMGGHGSTVSVSGTLDVSGVHAGEIGGLIQSSADYVKLDNTAVLNASGYTGGGNVLIGSDHFHGALADGSQLNILGNPISMTQNKHTYAAQGSSILVDALNSGNAGNVEVWGTNNTWFYGNISAQAKGASGSGGKVETSGGYLDIQGATVNALSAHGTVGTWLLDPYNINISTSASSNGAFNGGSPNTWTPSASGSNVNVTDISNNLATSNVIITTTNPGGAELGDITFSSGTISWSAPTSLTLSAANNISISGTAVITLTTAGSALYLRPDNGGDTGTTFNGTGTVAITSAANSISGSGSVFIYNNITGAQTFATANTSYSAIAGATTKTSYWLVHNSGVGGGNNTLATLSGLSTAWGRNFALATDIASGVNTTPIGNTTTAFTGKFSGSTAYKGVSGSSPFTISGLTLTNQGSNAGLFGVVSGATLQSIALNNLSISDSNVSNVGALAGSIQGATFLIGSFSVTQGTGTGINITGTGTNIGGLIGSFVSSVTPTIANAPSYTANMSVTGSSNVGGLIGFMGAATINRGSGLSLTGGTITGTTNVGGLIGEMGTNSVLSTAGSVSTSVGVSVVGSGAASAIGGLFGAVDGTTGTFNGTNTTLTNNANVTALSGTNYIGGLIGNFILPITTTYRLVNTGTVTGGTASNVGGIVGNISNASGTLTFSGFMTNSGAVSGASNVGGLVGNVGGDAGDTTLSGVFTNTLGGNITGTGNFVGGMIGRVGGGAGITTISGTGAVSQSCTLATCTISGVNDVGGIIGGVLLNAAITRTGAFTNTSTAANTISVSGTSWIGGLFGNVASTINAFSTSGNFTNQSNVTATGNNVGGIFGSFDKTNITLNDAMTNTGTITGTSSTTGVGGITGTLAGTAGNLITIGTTLSNTGSIFGASNVGGLFGSVSYVSLTGSTTMTLGVNLGPRSVSGTGNNVGGLIGSVDNSSLTGTKTVSTSNSATTSTPFNISGVNNVGGMFGLINATSTSTTISSASTSSVSAANATAPITITGTGNNVGGFIGHIMGTSNSITSTISGAGNMTLVGVNSSMQVTGVNNVGGIIGNLDAYSVFARTGTISTGANQIISSLTGTSSLGGLFGYLDVNSSFTSTSALINAANVSGSQNTSGVGGIFGTLNITGTTFSNNMTVSGTIDSLFSANGIGGIVGISDGNSYTGILTGSATIAAAFCTNVGGLFGLFKNGTLSGTNDMVVTGGTVGGNINVGGLIGQLGTGATFSRTGTVSRTGGTLSILSQNGGGLFGLVANGVTLFSPTALSNSATVQAVNTMTDIGGIFGQFAANGLTVTSSITQSGAVTRAPGVSVTNWGGVFGEFSGTSNFTGNISNTVGIGGNTGLIAGLGGIVGQLSGGTLSGSSISNNGAVSGVSSDPTSTSIGGIVGRMISGTLSGTFTNTGSVSVNATGTVTAVGGIIGYINGSGTNITLSGSFSNIGAVGVAGQTVNTGGLFGQIIGTAGNPINIPVTLSNNTQVSGLNNVGGLIGSASYVNLSGINKYDTTGLAPGSLTVSGTSNNVGGLYGNIDNSTVSGILSLTTATGTPTITVSGVSNIGGIAGNVSNTSFALGSNTITITSPQTISITGSGNNVGGLFGQFVSSTWSSSGGVTMSGTAINTITGVSQVGGFVGLFGANSIFAFTGSNPVSTGLNTVVQGSGGNIGGLFGSVSGAINAANDMTSSVTLINNAIVRSTANLSNIGGIFGNFDKSGLTINFGMQNNNTVFSLAGNASVMGGIIGLASGNSTFSELSSMSNTANIGGGAGNIRSIGGLIGSITAGTYQGTMTNSANVSGTRLSIGGLIGEVSGASALTPVIISDGSIANDFTLTGGTVSITTADVGRVGGLIGWISNYVIFTRQGNVSTSATATISSPDNYAGGLFGLISGSIVSSNDFNPATLVNNATILGSASADSQGGIIGAFNKSGLVINTTMTNNGTVSITDAVAGTNIGGIIGSILVSSTFTGPLTNHGSVLALGTSVSDSMGGIFGSALAGTFTGAMLNTGTISGKSNVGGLIGKADNISITGSADFKNTAGTVSGTSQVAGLIGSMNNTVFERTGSVVNTASISGSGDNIAGLFALISGTSGSFGTTGGNYTNSGNIVGSGTLLNVGALLGLYSNTNTNVSVANVTNTGTVTASNGTNVGGMMGHLMAGSWNGYYSSLADVTGYSNVGGNVGNMSNASVTRMYYLNTVTGDNNVGGIAGNNSGTISNAMFGGTVAFTTTNAGGIAGVNTGTIMNSLAVGTLHGLGTQQGALVGDNTGGTLVSDFYSINTFPGSHAVGNSTSDPAGAYKGDYYTLNKSSTFTSYGWQFPTIWTELADHYVTLTWCGINCGVLDPSPPIPPTPPGPSPTPVNLPTGLDVVDRMLTQTNVIQYENDTNFHTLIQTTFVYNLRFNSFPYKAKVLVFKTIPPSREYDDPIATVQMAIGALKHHQ